MTEANLAYQQEDLTRLELLCGALEHNATGDAADHLAALAITPLNEVRERAEYAARQKRDLLLELTLHLKRQAEDVQRRGPAMVPRPVPPGTLVERALRDIAALAPSRLLRFPTEFSMGELSVRAERDAGARTTVLGQARGTVPAPFGKAVILRLKATCGDLSPLGNLDPEDLQGIVDEWPDFVNLKDDQVRPLARFPGIEVIQLGRTEITGRVFDHFPALHELRVLVLDETAFDDRGLARLEDCVWMQRLDLSFTKITGSGLPALHNMAALRDLSLYGTAVADADLAVLGHLPGLRNLNLGLTGITDATGSHLRELRVLEVLNLGGTGVTDAIVASLSALPALRELVLWETAITETGLASLQSLETLRYLDVDQTGVQPAALARFHAARPDVRLPGDIWVG